MNLRKLRWLAVLILCGLCSVSCYAKTWPSCAWPWIAPGQRYVTPAQVIGAPSQRLPLQGNHPEALDSPRKDPDSGYVVTGDKVDLVTTCDGYDYVRYHGKSRVSTGWVDKSRIQVIGKPFVSLPPNAALLCKAAQDTLNQNFGNGVLKQLTLSDVSPNVFGNLNIDVPDGSVVHVRTGGRPLAIANLDTGGTCRASSTIVMSDDLSARISPNDTDDRNPRNSGRDFWSSGYIETPVEVLGQPMVLDAGSGTDNSMFLSMIGKDGDIVPTCEGHRISLKPQIQTSTNDDVCKALLSNKAAIISTEKPAASSRLILSKVPSTFLPKKDGSNNPTSFAFHDQENAAEVTYTLIKSGTFDVDNSGHQSHVGVVFMRDGDSSAGCGDFLDDQLSLVYIDKNGVADLSSTVSQAFKNPFKNTNDANFLKYKGKTYIKLDPPNDDPITVKMMDSEGVHDVCSYQVRHYEFKPISTGP